MEEEDNKMNKSRKLEMYSKGDEEGKMKDIFGNLRNLESLKTKTHLSTPTTHISGITLVALVVTILFSYDEKLKFSNSKGFLLQTI